MISSTLSRLLNATICANARSNPGGPPAPEPASATAPEDDIPDPSTPRLPPTFVSPGGGPRSPPVDDVNDDQEGKELAADDEEDDAAGADVELRDDDRWASYSGASSGETRAR
jgi:hypothetical protein